MRSIVTTLLVAATALVWLVEVLIAGLIDDRRTHRATDLVRAMSSVVIYLGVLISWLYFGLALQLRFDVSTFGGGLMSPSPA